jgi:hypothetical protein
MTDPKHVQDRFKLLMANWIRRDRAFAQESGQEEEYREGEQILE